MFFFFFIRIFSFLSGRKLPRHFFRMVWAHVILVWLLCLNWFQFFFFCVFGNTVFPFRNSVYKYIWQSCFPYEATNQEYNMVSLSVSCPNSQLFNSPFSALNNVNLLSLFHLSFVTETSKLYTQADKRSCHYEGVRKVWPWLLSFSCLDVCIFHWV